MIQKTKVLQTLEEKTRSQTAKKATDNRIEKSLLAEITTLSPSEILDRILGHENPKEIVRHMPSGDFFWLIKKVGEDECLPLLELASEDQWTYLLDLEVWRKDRLDVEHTSLWLKRLEQAQPAGLVRWLLNRGQSLAFYYLFKNIELVIREPDREFDIPDGFFSLDGVFFIKVIDSRYRETIENILREVAHKDSNRYQALVLGLAGVLPAETEEEMYRMRNARLAEHGFLPYEEAISVYAPLDVEAIKKEDAKKSSGITIDKESWALAPLSPLYHAGTDNILGISLSEIADPMFLDRLRLEFAGLCNQVLSADGILAQDLDVLVKTCRKAAGYLNLALERLCGKDVSSAIKLLRRHSLVSIFRVGFGLVLKVKWEAERWIKTSWFEAQGLDYDFWGEEWAGMLSAMLEKRPRFYTGPSPEGEELRDFQWLSDLGDCAKVLRRLMVLDALFEQIAGRYPMEEDLVQSTRASFHPLLFNLWARKLLNLEPSLSAISLANARAFFRQLRSDRKRPPYRIDGFEDAFVEFFMSYASGSDPEAASILKETLLLIWHEFRDEYEWVPTRDLNRRYSRFISIAPS